MEALANLKSYQKKIIETLLGKFQLINVLDVNSIVEQEQMVCRKCGNTDFVKNGKPTGKQRYKCRGCSSTQFSDANTILYNLKLKDKWVDFVLLMLENSQNISCEAIGKELEINKKTAHQWRHKLLKAINQEGDLELATEVELDEIYLPFCVKGRIGKEKYDKYIAPGHPDNIESQLRIDEKLMEEESYQTIFMCAHNRLGDFDFSPAKIQKKGIIGEKDVRKVLSSRDLKGKTVITDSEPSMKAYLKSCENVIHQTFKSSDIKKGIIKEKSVHNNNINNTMMRLKNWLKDFFGVSTKYISNYLSWFRFRDMFELELIKQMVQKSVKGRDAYPKYKKAFEDYRDFLYS